MERRYLVATLAIIATFAVFSHGLRTLERVSLSYGQHLEANAQAKCNADASAASRWIVGKVRSHLRPGYAEEAQLLAEMDLPIVMAQAKAAEQVAKQNMAAAQCARATALREAERAQRQAMRMREKMAHASVKASAMPIAWEVNTAIDVNQRIQARTAAFAERIAAQSVRLQMAAERAREASAEIEDSGTEGTDDDADAGQASNSWNTHRCDTAKSSLRSTH
jgi:hypothetical protein